MKLLLSILFLLSFNCFAQSNGVIRRNWQKAQELRMAREKIREFNNRIRVTADGYMNQGQTGSCWLMASVNGNYHKYNSKVQAYCAQRNIPNCSAKVIMDKVVKCLKNKHGVISLSKKLFKGANFPYVADCKRSAMNDFNIHRETITSHPVRNNLPENHGAPRLPNTDNHADPELESHAFIQLPVSPQYIHDLASFYSQGDQVVLSLVINEGKSDEYLQDVLVTDMIVDGSYFHITILDSAGGRESNIILNEDGKVSGYGRDIINLGKIITIK